MTVYFTLDNVSFCVHGVKHEAADKPHFETRHVFLKGNCADIRRMLSADFLERIEEAAAEAAEDDIPFGDPQCVTSKAEHNHLTVELAERNPTLAEVNARRGYDEEVTP